MHKSPFIILFAALALSGSARAAAAPAASPYGQLAALETRVATIGFRLTTANADHCRMVTPQLGWLLGDRRLYDARRWPAARAAYRATDADAPFIAALAPVSPAAEGGLAVGDALIAVALASTAPHGDDAFARIAGFETGIAALAPHKAIEVTTGDGVRHMLMPVPGCASDFRVEARDAPAGGADGRLVLISAGLARFAADDAELAAAVAHELAHNILRHRDRLDAAGIDRGMLQHIGRSARLTRQTEADADRLSVWLMARAGYDPDAAVRFWEKFGRRKGKALFRAGTHPAWQDRVAALTRETAAMRAAVRIDRDARPPLIDAILPLE